MKLTNHVIDSYDVWCERNANEGLPNAIGFNVPKTSFKNTAVVRTSGVVSELAPISMQV
jgi:hypothetical protein